MFILYFPIKTKFGEFNNTFVLCFMTREIQHNYQVVFHCSLQPHLFNSLQFSTSKYIFQNSHPFFPPFLRDSAGVLGGEGERLLFFPAELALRSLRSGVREDWSDKTPSSTGSEGWRMRERAAEWEDGTVAHTRKGSGGRTREGGECCGGGGGDDQGFCHLSSTYKLKSDCCSPCIDRLKKLFELKWVL